MTTNRSADHLDDGPPDRSGRRPSGRSAARASATPKPAPAAPAARRSPLTEPERASAALQLLGDDTRRAIVEQLAFGPLAVGDLAGRLPVSRPAVSQHLGALKAAGLVTDQAVGTRRIYRLDPAGLDLLRTYLDRMWASALEGYQDAIELTDDKEQSS